VKLDPYSKKNLVQRQAVTLVIIHDIER